MENVMEKSWNFVLEKLYEPCQGSHTNTNFPKIILNVGEIPYTVLQFTPKSTVFVAMSGDVLALNSPYGLLSTCSQTYVKDYLELVKYVLSNDVSP